MLQLAGLIPGSALAETLRTVDVIDWFELSELFREENLILALPRLAVCVPLARRYRVMLPFFRLLHRTRSFNLP